MMTTSKSDIYTKSGYRRCIYVETRRGHVVDMRSTTKTDVFTTSGHRCCIDALMRRRRHVDITSTAKTAIFTTSGYRLCINVETRRCHYVDVTSATMYSGRSCSMHFYCSCRRQNIIKTVLRFPLKPHCVSGVMWVDRLLRSILAKILPAMERREIPL